MSDSQSQSQQKRNEAVRVFAAELNESTIEFQDQDEVEAAEEGNTRAPKYHLLPTGGRANRVLMMGTVTEIQQVNDEPVTLRAKIVDETGNFFVYAGKYNPEEVSFLSNLKTPEHLMVVGKPSSYTTDEGKTYVSVEPETITTVSKGARDRYTAEAATQTFDRLQAFEAGEAPFGDEAEEYYDFDHDDFHNDVSDIATETVAANEATAQPQTPAVN